MDIYNSRAGDGSIIKDITYAQMADAWSGEDVNLKSIIRNITSMNEIKNKRSSIPRNLRSLYIYGNDLGQFKEASPQLKNMGVDYSDYLRKHGKNPEDVVTYEGYLPHYPPVLPLDITNEELIDYINSSKNRSHGAYASYPKHHEYDDVAGYLQKLDVDNNEPVVVNSDLWDFSPNDYARHYSGNNDGNEGPINPKVWLMAKGLDMVGTPFILKNTDPIQRVDIEEFYDRYPELSDLSREVAKDFGWLAPITVTQNGVYPYDVNPVAALTGIQEVIKSNLGSGKKFGKK